MLGKTLTILSCLLGLGVASTVSCSAAVVQSQPLMQESEGTLVSLPGHVHPLAIARYDQGRVADSLQLPHMVLVLKRSDAQEQALTALLDQLHDPKAAMYHRWLTPEEFGQFFGASDQDIETLTAWLQRNGFTVDEVSPGRTTIIFSGTAAQVHQGFRTEIHSFSVRGVQHFANASDPQIPSSLSTLVAGFRSLNDFQAKPLHHMVGGFTRDKAAGVWKLSSTVAPNLTSLAGPMGDVRLVGPQDFYAIYNLKPLLDAGMNGAGQTIAVIEQSDVNPGDVTAFRSQFGLPAYPATANAAQGGVNYFKGVAGYCSDPGIVAGDEDEAILDVEWAGAVAPAATIDVVSCASSGSAQGTDLALTYIVNHLASTVSAMSYSYGACEAALGPAGNAFYKNTYQQAVAQGQTVVVSTGDGGAPGCDNFSAAAPNPATQGNAVNGLASTAYNIAAGGTDFSDVYQNLTSTYWTATNGPGYVSARSYVPETAWNGSCASPLLRSYAAKLGLNPGGSPEVWCNNQNFKAKYGSFVFLDGGSGGFSSQYSKPTWQSAFGVPNDLHRDLPDISLFASNFVYSHAIAVCQSDRGYACDQSNSTAAQTMAGGGTSFVAPEIAGLIALVNQKTNARQGQANYTLYALAASEYGSPTAPNTAVLNNCNGSQKGNGVGTGCMFYDVNATPSPSGGTVVDTIAQPCAAGTLNCVANARRDLYGILSSSSKSQVAAYPVGRGYDLATGLGSINFTNLVNNWTVAAVSGASTFATSTTLVAAPATIAADAATTLTATVTNSTYSSPLGVVNFYAGGATGRLLGTATLTAGRAPTASASLVVAGILLDPGANDLVAVFPGDGANDAASTSSTVKVNVGAVAYVLVTPAMTVAAGTPSVFILRSAAANVTQGEILTATLAPGAVTGSVAFSLGATPLGTAVVSSGKATLTIDSSVLAPGANLISASYSGDSRYNPVKASTTVMLANGIVNLGSVNVASKSPVQQFKVTFLKAATVGVISNLTIGGSNQDYLDGGSTTCKAQAYAINATCTISLAYAPSLPGTRLGSVVLYDGGNIPIVSLAATGTGMAPLLSFGFAAPTVTNSSFNGPTSVSVDGTGNMFVTDTLNNRVVEIPVNGGALNLGTGFIYPVGTAVDGAGNLYVADEASGIAKIPNEHGTLNGAHQTKLSIAGGFNLPEELAFDSLGSLYIADAFNNRIVKLASVNGALDVAHPIFLGTGLTGPMGVAVDAAGNVFIADTGFPVNPANGIYGRIVEVVAATGIQRTLDTIKNTNAPSSIKIDASGQLFIADTDNSQILKVSPDLTTTSVLNTSVNAANPQFFGSMALDLQGNLWAPDFLNNQIVRLAQNAPNLDMGAPDGNGTMGPVTVAINNIGNTALTFYSFNPPVNFSQSGGTCVPATPVNPAQNCTLSILYQQPKGLFQGAAGAFNILDNVNNQPLATAHVDPIVVNARVPVDLGASCWSANFPYGGIYTCTANVSSRGGTPTGMLHYTVDGAPFDVAINGGNADFTVTNAHGGNHTVVLSYLAQGSFAASQVLSEYFTVAPASLYYIGLTPSSYYQSARTPLLLSVTTTWSTTPATGTFTFYDGSVVVGTAPIAADGTASISLSGLAVRTHAFTVSFKGTSDYETGTSRSVNVQLY